MSYYHMELADEYLAMALRYHRNGCKELAVMYFDMAIEMGG